MKENSEKTKTKDITYEDVELSDYLKENENTTLSNIIFSVRSGTLDIKQWNSWSYENNLCLMCELKEETMDHFLICQAVQRSRHEAQDEDNSRQAPKSKS